VALMAKRPTPEMIAQVLSVPERIMFCIASATTWQKAGLTHVAARQRRRLIDRKATGS
jgi:hypothetical protein